MAHSMNKKVFFELEWIFLLKRKLNIQKQNLSSYQNHLLLQIITSFFWKFTGLLI